MKTVNNLNSSTPATQTLYAYTDKSIVCALHKSR